MRPMVAGRAVDEKISTNRDLPSIHELDIWCDDDGITVFQSLPHFDSGFRIQAANDADPSNNSSANSPDISVALIVSDGTFGNCYNRFQFSRRPDFQKTFLDAH